MGLNLLTPLHFIHRITSFIVIVNWSNNARAEAGGQSRSDEKRMAAVVVGTTDAAAAAAAGLMAQ